LAEFECLTFSGESYNCYGLELVKRNLEIKGHKIYPFSLNSDRPVLISLYWPEQLYPFLRLRFHKNLKNRRIIVGGNYPTTSPNALLPFDVEVFMGDGELFDPFSESYMAGKDRKRAVIDEIHPILYEDLQKNRRSFCELSRGCKNRCYFCQYGWLKPYREASLVDIEEILRSVKTKSIRAFAADRTSHSRFSEIQKLFQKLGKTDTGSDVTLRGILKNPETLEYLRKVRIGVEGMSYRIRKRIGKPFTDNEIVEFCRLVAKYGIKTMDWYMIYGLPGETPSEMESFCKLLDRIDAEMPEGYTIAIHWNAFSPSAQTPLQWYRPAMGKRQYLVDFANLWRGRKIKLTNRPLLTSDWTMIRRMLAIRSTPKTAKLVYNFAFHESKFKKYPRHFLELFKETAGFDLVGPYPTDRPLPWDEYCDYERDKMLSIWGKVRKDAGEEA